MTQVTKEEIKAAKLLRRISHECEKALKGVDMSMNTIQRIDMLIEHFFREDDKEHCKRWPK